MTLLPEKLEDFRKAFNAAVDRRWPADQRHPLQVIDSLAQVHELHESLATLLERLEPFGMDNEAPIWGLKGVQLQDVRRMSEGKHLRAQAVDPHTGAELSVIGFNWGHAEVSQPVDLAVVLEWNYFRNSKTLQARILDLQT